ncbi:MAG: MinD/ParA family protein [Oscillospiraceae bacterium]|nr:MinD/ParA family protein [Oscillospiraceae bacterium]
MKDQADNLRKAIERLGAVRVQDTDGGPAALRNAGPLVRRNTGPARVFAVTSGKGGVGKTSVSVNLALALSEMQYKTLIIDADIGLANVEVLFGLTPGHSLMDCICGDRPIREIMCEAPRMVRLISGGSGVEELARMGEPQMVAFISELSDLDDEFDVIIIDTGAGVSETVLGMAVAADEAVVVTTPEPTSLTDAYALIKAVVAREREKCIRIIVNRADSEAEAAEIMGKLAKVSDKFLDLKLNKLGYILNDPLVVRSIKQQQPFILSSPYSRASKSVRDIALRLMEAEALHPSEKYRGMSGFFDRIIKFVNMQLK